MSSFSFHSLESLESGSSTSETMPETSSSGPSNSMSFVESVVNRVIDVATTTATGSMQSSEPMQQQPIELVVVSGAKRLMEQIDNAHDMLKESILLKKARHSLGPAKLEQRLGGILCCSVCLDLPKSSVYQCTNGHLMCSGCFSHLLADARIRDETSTCPNCRCVISKDVCSRNLAVEKAVRELPGQCQFCSRELARSGLEKHMSDECEERLVKCKYSPIGCPWNGPFHEADSHHLICMHPNKAGREVLSHLSTIESKCREERSIYEGLIKLLSYEKISINDLQYRPYRTDEYIHKLFYETTRFTAFNMSWVCKARVNDDQRDPTQSVDRQLSFSLVLKSKISTPMPIYYILLKGPHGDMKLSPRVYRHDFTETAMETPYNVISLASSIECNRLLAAKMISFRLIMVLATK